MTNWIVAFSKPENGKRIKGLLVRGGFSVTAVCSSGAQVLAAADGLAGGVVVAGVRFADMQYRELRRDLPASFELLLLASPASWPEQPIAGVTCLPMPLKVQDLLETAGRLEETRERERRRQKRSPRERSEEELRLIGEAKELLAARNGMTETEAYRYLQKCSMDSGTGLTETAQKLISLIRGV